MKQQTYESSRLDGSLVHAVESTITDDSGLIPRPHTSTIDSTILPSPRHHSIEISLDPLNIDSLWNQETTRVSMPFTSITKGDGWVERGQRCIIPFGNDYLVFVVGLVVLGWGFRTITVRNQDMGNGGVLEVVSDIEGSMVEFKDGDNPEDGDECWDHDTGQSEVGEYGSLARLIISKYPGSVG